MKPSEPLADAKTTGGNSLDGPGSNGIAQRAHEFARTEAEAAEQVEFDRMAEARAAKRANKPFAITGPAILAAAVEAAQPVADDDEAAKLAAKRARSAANSRASRARIKARKAAEAAAQ